MPIFGPGPIDSELPAAAALTDADANPTVPGVGGYMMAWDATNTVWKRVAVVPGTNFIKPSLGNAATAGDNQSNTVAFPWDSGGSGRLSAGAPFGFNGVGWDKWRVNQDATLLASAARTITTASADQTNYNGSGVIVVLDMSVIGTGSVTLTIQGKDSISGNYYTLLAGAAVVSNSTNVYTVYPSAPATANVSANSPLPRTWRVNVVANNANSASYSVSASVIL